MNGAAQNSSSATNSMSQNDLRRTFIAMLFALVAATIAQEIGELLFVLTGGWDLAVSPSGILGNLLFGQGMLLASLTHALLALLLVSNSWIMWSRSQAAGHKTEMASVFSKEFIILLTEVFLVVLYFSVAKTMEQNYTEYTKNKFIADYVGKTSSRPEALQLMWVFCVYFIWDVIVDVMYSPREASIQTGGRVNWLTKTNSFLQGVLTYCSISLVCVFAALFVGSVSPSNATPYQAVLGDVALIALLLFFVVGKKLEYYLTDIFEEEKTRKNTKRSDPPSKRSLVLIAGLVFIYSFSILVVTCFQK